MEDEVKITSDNVGGEGSAENIKTEPSDKEMLSSFLNKDSKSDSKTPVETAQSAEDHQDPKKKQGQGKAAERIGELTRKHKTTQAELLRVQKEFEEYRKNAKPLVRSEQSTDEEYISKLADNTVNERLQTEKIKQLESEAEVAKAQVFEENIRSQVDNYEEFVKDYSDYAPIISEHDALTTEYVMKSHVGPKMLKELFVKLKDEVFAEAWFTMPASKKSIILYELEKHVQSTKQTQPTVTKAPKSIIPGNGAHNNAPKSDKEMLDAFFSKRK